MTDAFWVAAFGAASIIVPATLTVYLTVWSRRHIGSSNGHGSANEAIHKLLVNQMTSDLSNEVRFDILFRHLKISPPKLPTYEMVEQLLAFKQETEEL